MDLELVFQTINGKARRKEEEIKQFLMAIQTEKKNIKPNETTFESSIKYPKK